jgi:predicted nucleotidyltransferase/DNA-binding XRE family transcriptional regulator
MRSTATSGAVLREARTRAGLSQAELASRVGVAQSVISVYESDRRQPALATLASFIEATGFDLDVRLRRRGLDRLGGPLGKRLRRHRPRLLRLAREAGVNVHGVFGSVARGEDRHDSDVDLLADLPAGMGLIGRARVEAQLEQLLGAPVELIPAADLKPGGPAVLSELVPL